VIVFACATNITALTNARVINRRTVALLMICLSTLDPACAVGARMPAASQAGVALFQLPVFSHAGAVLPLDTAALSAFVSVVRKAILQVHAFRDGLLARKITSIRGWYDRRRRNEGAERESGHERLHVTSPIVGHQAPRGQCGIVDVAFCFAGVEQWLQSMSRRPRVRPAQDLRIGCSGRNWKFPLDMHSIVMGIVA
jgi:hypothetical protein